MQYEVTIKMLVESPHGKEQVAKQTESICEFGTVMDAFADGLELSRNPRLLNVDVGRGSGCSKAQA